MQQAGCSSGQAAPNLSQKGITCKTDLRSASTGNFILWWGELQSWTDERFLLQHLVVALSSLFSGDWGGGYSWRWVQDVWLLHQRRAGCGWEPLPRHGGRLTGRPRSLAEVANHNKDLLLHLDVYCVFGHLSSHPSTKILFHAQQNYCINHKSLMYGICSCCYLFDQGPPSHSPH